MYLNIIASFPDNNPTSELNSALQPAFDLLQQLYDEYKILSRKTNPAFIIVPQIILREHLIISPVVPNGVYYPPKMPRGISVRDLQNDQTPIPPFISDRIDKKSLLWTILHETIHNAAQRNQRFSDPFHQAFLEMLTDRMTEYIFVRTIDDSDDIAIGSYSKLRALADILMYSNVISEEEFIKLALQQNVVSFLARLQEVKIDNLDIESQQIFIGGLIRLGILPPQTKTVGLQQYKGKTVLDILAASFEHRPKVWFDLFSYTRFYEFWRDSRDIQAKDTSIESFFLECFDDHGFLTPLGNRLYQEYALTHDLPENKNFTRDSQYYDVKLNTVKRILYLAGIIPENGNQFDRFLENIRESVLELMERDPKLKPREDSEIAEVDIILINILRASLYNIPSQNKENLTLNKIQERVLMFIRSFIPHGRNLELEHLRFAEKIMLVSSDLQGLFMDP